MLKKILITLTLTAVITNNFLSIAFAEGETLTTAQTAGLGVVLVGAGIMVNQTDQLAGVVQDYVNKVPGAVDWIKNQANLTAEGTLYLTNDFLQTTRSYVDSIAQYVSTGLQQESLTSGPISTGNYVTTAGSTYSYVNYSGYATLSYFGYTKNVNYLNVRSITGIKIQADTATTYYVNPIGTYSWTHDQPDLIRTGLENVLGIVVPKSVFTTGEKATYSTIPFAIDSAITWPENKNTLPIALPGEGITSLPLTQSGILDLVIDTPIDPPVDPPASEINWDKLKMTGTLFTNKFPFSLPWDLFESFRSFNTGPGSEEHKVFTFDLSSTMLQQSFNVNLEWFEEYIPIIKMVELAIFDIGLILGTRKLLGGDA